MREPAATDTDQASTASPYSVSLDVPAGGVAFGGVCDGQNATTAWTGLTERVDSTFADDPQVYSMASLAFTTAQSGLTVTANITSAAGGAAAFASLGPA